MDYTNWSEEDLEELDQKFDALSEHLGIEFVFEKVSDGSDGADRSRVYVRQKQQSQPIVNNTPTGLVGPTVPSAVEEPPQAVEEPPQAVEPTSYEKKYRRSKNEY